MMKGKSKMDLREKRMSLNNYVKELIMSGKYEEAINCLDNNEEERIKSEEKYRILFKESKDPTLIIKNDHFIDANQAALDILKLKSNKELLAIHPADISPEYQDDRRKSLEKAEEMMQFAREKGSHRFEWTHKNSINELFPVEVSLTAIPFQNQELLYTVWRDISERKKAENALRISNENYKALAENINEGIYQTDKGVIVNINNAFASMYGFEKEEMIGMRAWMLAKPEIRINIKKEFIHKVKTKNTNPVEVECIRKDGSNFWAEIRLSEFYDNECVFGVVSDITARKRAEDALRESEEKFRFITENSNDMLFTMDLDLNFTYLSPATKKIYGYTQEERKQLGLQKIFTKKSYEQIKSALKTHLNNFEHIQPDKIIALELEASHKNRTLIWVEVKAGFIYDQVGKPIGIKGNTRDITERKRAEQALKKSELALKELNATKDKFFSIIAHDLKSPFSGILGFTELLLKPDNKYNQSMRESLLKALNKNAKVTYELINNLLLWAQNQQNNIHYSFGNLPVSDIIKPGIALLKNNSRVKEIFINQHLDEALVAYCDKNTIETVIRNLLANAIKFTPKYGHIDITADEYNDEYILITVADTGVGIPEKQLHKLFRTDVSYSTEGTEKEKGSGLGLILCKDFVEKNGGKIWVESEHGKGSEFKFTLPKGSLHAKTEK